MLSKLFHRSARPNRTPARRGPVLALEALEHRTVMSAASITIATLNTHPMPVADSPGQPGLPAVVSSPNGPAVSEPPANELPILPPRVTDQSGSPTLGTPTMGQPSTASEISSMPQLQADYCTPIYVN
jgi:hypothetical protein